MTATLQDEAVLAARLQAGDTDALESFLDLVRHKLFGYSVLMCRQRDDAEEVTQEALLRIFERFDQLQEPALVRPWMFRIARNACLMHRRHSRFAPERELSLDELVPAPDGGGRGLQIADWSRLPETQVLRREMRRKLHQAIGELPEAFRSVVLLRDMEERSTAETASVLGLQEEAVRTRLHRARLALRQRLDRELLAREARKIDSRL